MDSDVINAWRVVHLHRQTRVRTDSGVFSINYVAACLECGEHGCPPWAEAETVIAEAIGVELDRRGWRVDR